jgi:hypothetical protein
MLIQDREIIITDKDNSRAYLTIESNEDDTFEMEQFSEWCDAFEYIENVQTDEIMEEIALYVEEQCNRKVTQVATFLPNSEEITDGVLLYVHLSFE